MKFNSPGLDLRFVERTVLTVIALAALAIPFVLQAQTSVNVTTTVHDLSLGGVALNTLSDLYQGGATHSATYNSFHLYGQTLQHQLGERRWRRLVFNALQPDHTENSAESEQRCIRPASV